MTVRSRLLAGTAAIALGGLLGCSAQPAETPDVAAPVAPSTGAPTTPTPPTTPTTTPTRKPSVPAAPTALDTRLIAAAWKNDVATARRLITAGADVNAADATVQSAFLIAASEGHLDLLELTLRHGADVRSLDSYRGTALIRAAERGHAAVVGRLVRAGTPVDHVNRLGWTALHEAIVLGDGSPRYVDTARILVAARADLALASAKDGVTPLAHARTRGQAAVERLLRAATGAGRTGPADLLAAATTGAADQVAIALRGGVPLESRDSHRRTPLLLAALNDRLDAARLLVALGADPDAQDDRSDSAWLVTGVTGSVAMLEVLLPAGPDLTLRNRFGGTSVIPASERGHVDYVRRVVRTGIAVNHVNDLGWTALLEAVILGDGTAPYQEIVRILLAAGANPSLADKDGTTPLAHATGKGQAAVAGILRKSGAR